MVGFILRNTLSDFGTVSRGVCRVTGDNFLQSIAELKAIEPDAERARNADAAGRVTSLSGDEAVSMNMWGFTPQIFGELQEHFEKFLELHGSELQSESYIPSAINELVSENLVRVRVLRTDDPWFGVTYREDRPHVVTSISNLIQKGHYPERLWP
jgi:hypothetical protein